MALTEEGTNTTMLVQPSGFGNNGFGMNGDWAWIILLLLAFGGGWGGGFNGGGMGYDFPWLINGQNGINTNTNAGFRDAMLNDGITSIRGGIGDISTQLCGGFAGVTAGITGAQNALAQQMYANQIADLERSFAAQTANTAGLSGLSSQLSQCCCDNRLATVQTQTVVANEGAETRAAIQAQTQAILDKMCADKIEEKNDIIAQLRSELMYARGQASQDVQTAAIQAGQRALANEVEQYVLPTPRPAYVVANPNCCTNSCGCGSF